MEHLKPIAYIQNDFTTKFGVPRQSNLVEDIRSVILFENEYRSTEAVRGLDSFSYLWLIWGFSEAENHSWVPTVRPPKLGGNTHMGVFATRSPFRPNSLGLSSVKLDKIEYSAEQGPAIYVKGADLMNGTPIYDIKPYLPYTDSHPNALAGFTENNPRTRLLQVSFAQKLAESLPKETQQLLRSLLAQDPRPSYHNDPSRVYGMAFGSMDVKFSVDGETLFIHDVVDVSNKI